MYYDNYIGFIIIGLMLLIISILILLYHIYLGINYGWDYIIVGYSKLAGKTATQIKSAIYFDIFVLVVSVLIILYGLYQKYLSYE